MAVRVNQAIRQAGIEIPFPQRDLHLRSVSKEVAQQVDAARIPPQT
jgi:small-conductance mechanosensitive channel